MARFDQSNVFPIMLLVLYVMFILGLLYFTVRTGNRLFNVMMMFGALFGTLFLFFTYEYLPAGWRNPDVCCVDSSTQVSGVYVPGEIERGMGGMVRVYIYCKKYYVPDSFFKDTAKGLNYLMTKLTFNARVAFDCHESDMLIDDKTQRLIIKGWDWGSRRVEKSVFGDNVEVDELRTRNTVYINIIAKLKSISDAMSDEGSSETMKWAQIVSKVVKEIPRGMDHAEYKALTQDTNQAQIGGAK